MTQPAPSEMNWDLSAYFPSFDGPEKRRFSEQLSHDVLALAKSAQGLPDLDAASAGEWERIVLGYEGLSARLSHLSSYVGALASCDASNEAYRQDEARLSSLYASFEKLGVQLTRAFKHVSDADFANFTARAALDGAGYALGRIREDAKFSMAPELEELSADLGMDGIEAWGRLYDTMSGVLTFEMKFPDGKSEVVPMAQRRSLMSDSDRRVRQAAFDGGNAAWARSADTAAAALNAIAGTRHTLNARRGVEHFLDVALFQSALSRKTLDAMFEAIHAHRDIPQRFLRIKARAMGIPSVAWFDLEAPLPIESEGRLSWEKGRTAVADAFGRAYPELARFFGQVLDKRWVEYEPRKTKRPGAFCTSSPLINESRVFMTYQGSLGDVSTLAHEVGHAFHSHVMQDLRLLSRRYPMTLAETASTFAEQILAEGLLTNPALSDGDRALLLAKQLADGTAFLLDIPVRFQFEKAFYEERAEGEVSVSRLKQLMSETQGQLFGDALAEDGRDPYFWASKLHFFITGVTFYNFPYTFGYLLSRGLFAEFKRQGAEFLPRYEQFLALTGSAPAHEVARRALGEDLEHPEFWARSIESLNEPLDQLCELLPRVLPGVSLEGL